jgi:hypothetical protein
MPASSIRLTRELILELIAPHYNIDKNKTGLMLTKDDPEYIEVLWEGQYD